MQRKVIIGLGNPGKEYENTYHNAGFLALDACFPETADVSWEKHKKLFEYLDLKDTVLIKPLTYMNESGRAAKEALKKFKAHPEDLTVIHDDSDLTIGNFKASVARNSAGHNGVQSIINEIKTKDFTRIRIGIRPTKEIRRQKAGEFALKKITARDKATLEKVFEKIQLSYFP